MTDNPHYVTHEEAKEIGCVMSMARDNPSIVYQTCLGPNCMAWRWTSASGKIWFWAATERDPEPRENWIPIERFEVNGRQAGKFKEAPTHGYCGMVRT